MDVKAKHPAFANNHVDRIEFEAHYAPLLDLPVEIIERLFALKRADAAVEKHAIGVPALQLATDLDGRHVLEEAPGRDCVIDRRIDIAFEEQQRFEHIGADSLKIAKRDRK